MSLELDACQAMSCGYAPAQCLDIDLQISARVSVSTGRLTSRKVSGNAILCKLGDTCCKNNLHF